MENYKWFLDFWFVFDVWKRRGCSSNEKEQKK
jgi:hypothetical protein